MNRISELWMWLKAAGAGSFVYGVFRCVWELRERAERKRSAANAEAAEAARASGARIEAVVGSLCCFQAPSLHELKASGALDLSYDELVEVLRRQDERGTVSILKRNPWLSQTSKAQEILRRLRTYPADGGHDPQELQKLLRELAPESLM